MSIDINGMSIQSLTKGKVKRLVQERDVKTDGVMPDYYTEYIDVVRNVST